MTTTQDHTNAFTLTITELATELGMTATEFIQTVRQQLADGDWDGGQVDLYSVCDALEIDYVAKYLRYALDAMVPHIEHHTIEASPAIHQLHPGTVEDCPSELCATLRV